MQAVNGKLALQLIDGNHFDFVIMDMRMPVLGGAATCRAIRRKEETTRTYLPIIAITADVFNETPESCMDAGADGYLAKPFEPSELLAVIEKNLSRLKENVQPPKLLISADFDYQAALQKAAGNQATAKAAITAFPADAARLLTQLAATVQTGEANQTSKTAAMLKQLALHAGAARCTDLALKLELQLRNNKTQQAQEVLSEIQTSLDNYKRNATLSEGLMFEVD